MPSVHIMSKKTILIVIIVFVLFLSGIILLFIQNKRITADALTIIPDDVAVVFESKDFPAFLQEIRNNKMLDEDIKSMPGLKNIHSGMVWLDSLFNRDTETQILFSDNPLYLTLHRINNEKTGFSFFIAIKRNSDERKIIKLIKSYVNGKGNISEHIFDKTKVYDVSFDKLKNLGNFSFAFPKGVMALSYSSTLVDKSIVQSRSSSSLRDDKGFASVRKTAGKNVSANLYINFKQLGNLASTLTDDPGRTNFDQLKYFATWAELDLTLKDDAILLNGFNYCSPDNKGYVNIFKGQAPQTIDLESEIPSDALSFFSITIGDNIKFREDYDRFLKSNNLIYNKLTADSSLGEPSPDLIKTFYSLTSSEAGVVVRGNIDSSEQTSTFALIKIKDTQATEDEIKKIIAFPSKNLNGQNNKIKANKKGEVPEEPGFTIYKLPFDSLPSRLFGSLFAGKYSYVCIINGFSIFADSEEELDNYLRFIDEQEPLATNIAYRKFSENLSSVCNFYFYADFKRLTTWLTRFLSPSNKQLVNNNILSCPGITAIGLQMQSGEEMVYSNFIIKGNPVNSTAPKIVWTCKIDTAFDFKPCLLNNFNGRENEIFIQDKKNDIYLIDKEGKITWKNKLPEKITSNVYQVDYFNNGKLQLLFNTQNYIYLIDRNGKNVENYPIKLKSPATNGISVFDYDNKRQYRYFVACENKKVLAFTKDGKPLNGWGFKGSDKPVRSNIQYFQSGNKDYIIFSDGHKTYILDRKGNARINVKPEILKSKNNQFFLEEKTADKPSHFITTDTCGNIWSIYMNGAIEKSVIHPYGSNHFFDLQDLNGDKKKEYIFIDDTRMEVISLSKQTLFTYDFEQRIGFNPLFYYFSGNEKKIGVVSPLNNKIFMIGNNGNLYNGFPLKGNTQFTISNLNKDGKFSLLTGSDGNILINYSIQ
jgi:hypothetical protein